MVVHQGSMLTDENRSMGMGTFCPPDSGGSISSHLPWYIFVGLSFLGMIYKTQRPTVSEGKRCKRRAVGSRSWLEIYPMLGSRNAGPLWVEPWNCRVYWLCPLARQGCLLDRAWFENVPIISAIFFQKTWPWRKSRSYFSWCILLWGARD
jgi:hypothetical protein